MQRLLREKTGQESAASDDALREAILAAIDAGGERTVKLAEPIDVYFLYSTAWADDDGTIPFRTDFYERDKKLIEALSAKSPLLQ